MSAYKTITCSFKDLETLVEALQSLKYKPVIHEEKQNLNGYSGDKREQLAEIIVPRCQISSASNDLGFSYNQSLEEYQMICSDFDLRTGIGDRVRQAYSIIAIKSALKKNKFDVKSEVKNKQIVMTASKII